jgi:hypothetical protein
MNEEDLDLSLQPDGHQILIVPFFLVLTLYSICPFIFFIKFIASFPPVFSFRLLFAHLSEPSIFYDPFLQANEKVQYKFCSPN